MKKVIKTLLIILLVVVLLAGAYFAYIMLSYHRIEDKQSLNVEESAATAEKLVPENEALSLTTWNIGFAAYLQDYTFFMDGGEESRARSKDAVIQNMNDIVDVLEQQNSDFYFIQEVDFDGTRSYKVDERKVIHEALDDKAYVFAQNYDSPYLMYPFTSPHGANKSGIVTLSGYGIDNSIRRSLPIQTDVAKFLDLDRCFSVSEVKTSEGHSLFLVNFHLSAYTTDPTIVTQQLGMLYDIMETEYEKGNYVICGGDFNMDLLGDSAGIFGVEGGENASWCQPFPVEDIPEHISLVAAFDENNKVASCRNNDMPYEPGKTFTCTVDGFLVTENVEVDKAEVVDQEFMHSDHNPVHLEFKLKKAFAEKYVQESF